MWCRHNFLILLITVIKVHNIKQLYLSRSFYLAMERHLHEWSNECISRSSLACLAEWFDPILLILGMENSLLHVPSWISPVFSSSTSTVPLPKYVIPLFVLNPLCKVHAVWIILSITSRRVEIGVWNIRNQLASTPKAFSTIRRALDNLWLNIFSS